MKKKILMPFILGLVATLLIGCGEKVNLGMNELTLKQLEKKLDNRETFVFMTFAATDEDVKKTKLIEAYDDGLKRTGLKGFYVNLEKESQETIDSLGKRYSSSKMSEPWNPDEDGLMRAENGNVVGSRASLSRENIISKANEDKGFNPEFQSDYDTREISNQIENIMEQIQVNNLELTYK